MRTILLATLVALCASSASAVGPYSRPLGPYRYAAPRYAYPNGAALYRANVNAISGGYNYRVPQAHLGGYGYGAGGYGGYGFYQPWSSFSNPYFTTFNGGMIGPGFYAPFTFSTPNYYGFGPGF